MSPKTIPTYRVEFRPPGGSPWVMETTDPAKIGPWIAEMYGLFPWNPSWGQMTAASIVCGSLERA